MSTLFDRLKPEYKEALMEYKENYPFTGEEALSDLKQKDNVGRIEYYTVVVLCFATKQDDTCPFDFFD